MPATPISWMVSTSLPMTSAVTCASSATGMSLVPAQTTAIFPLPRIVLVAPEADDAGEREILGAGQLRTTTCAHSRSARVIRTLCALSQQRCRDGNHLLRSLPFGEDHFRHAVAQRAMMIDLGEAQVFERHVAHADHGRVDIHCAVAHLLEQRPELILIHEARISERVLRDPYLRQL